MSRSTSRTTDWGFEVDFPDDGWIWAPAPDEDVAAWAQEVCEDLYVEDPRQETELASQLREFARAFRAREHTAGALWLPDPQHGVLASLSVDVISEAQPPLSLDTVEARERALAPEGVAPPVVERVELPAGPAVRARRLDPSPEAGLGGLAPVTELVSHTVVPGDLLAADGTPAGVRHVVSWTLLSEGDDLAALADDAARLLSITRG